MQRSCRQIANHVPWECANGSFTNQHTNHIPELYAVTNRGNSKVGNTNDGNSIESDTDSDGKHLVSVEVAHSKQGGRQRVGTSVTTQTETITDAQTPRLILGPVSTEVSSVVLLATIATIG